MLTKEKKLEILDRVEQHLLRQNARAVARQETDTCSYQTEDGKRCAIGSLMTNEAIQFLRERSKLTAYIMDVDVLAALRMSQILESDLTPSDGQFMKSIQAIHDRHSPEVLDQFRQSITEEA